MVNRWGNNGNSDRFYFGGAPKSLQMVTAAMKLKDTCSLGGREKKKKKTMTELQSILKSRGITLLTQLPLVKAMIFPVVTYGCESCTMKKAKL